MSAVRAEWRWLAGLFVLALALRLGFVLAVGRPHFPSAGGLPFNDMFFYHATAKALADGQGFIGFDGSATARWPPVFPFLLSLVYRVAGPHPGAGELLNAVLAALTVPLLQLAALRGFGDRAARVAALALAAMPGQIMVAEGLLAESTYALLLVALLLGLAWAPPTRWGALGLGVLVGVAALTRGEGALLVALPVAVWIGVLPRRELLSRTAVLVLGMALVVAPWAVRNALALDSFVGVSTNSSQTLYSGHNPAAYGGPSYPTSPEIRAKLLRVPRADGEVGQARVLRHAAVDWAVHHPLGELTLIPRKLAYLGEGDAQLIQVGTTLGGSAGDSGRPVVGGIKPVITDDGQFAVLLGTVADTAWYALLALTVLALLLVGGRLWRYATTRASIVALATSILLYGFVFYGNVRYRLPLEPLMIMLVAPAAVAVWDQRGRLRDSLSG